RRRVVDLLGIDVESDRFGEVGVHHCDERPVAAAVVDQSPARPRRDQRARHVEPAAMAPAHEAARAVDLLPRVIAGFQEIVRRFHWLTGDELHNSATPNAQVTSNLQRPKIPKEEDRTPKTRKDRFGFISSTFAVVDLNRFGRWPLGVTWELRSCGVVELSSLAASAPERREQYLPELRVLQQRERRLPVPVEIGGLAQQRDD